MSHIAELFIVTIVLNIYIPTDIDIKSQECKYRKLRNQVIKNNLTKVKVYIFLISLVDTLKSQAL